MPHDVIQSPEVEPAGPTTWECVELPLTTRVASPSGTILTLTGAFMLFIAIVGAGMWAEASTEVRLDAQALPASSSPRVADGMAFGSPVVSPRTVEPTPLVSLLLPADGEVVLGSSVVVAGRTNVGRSGQPGRSITLVHVIVVRGEKSLGEADLELIGDSFAGLIVVEGQARGHGVELRIADARRPEVILLTVPFVLGPGR